ncbi:hypothetical protein VTL71DRAFT_10641 [Oculimacula yallundae]|uniref:Uncharacterized protein n=1 Tax=Oculimacula yallundae TaxID=86028 RepID=A0ABR4CU28_9HELO
MANSSQIRFGFDIGIFYSAIDSTGQSKDSLFPQLVSVRSIEAVTERYVMFAPEFWDPPLIIDYAFDEADIDLDVRIRASRPVRLANGMYCIGWYLE